MMNNLIKTFVLAALLLPANILFAQNTERPRIIGLAHVSIKVSDINKARAYYGTFLGYDEAFTYYNKDSSVSVAFFKVNDRQYIEITPTLQPKEVERLGHFCFQTDDAEKMRLYLSAKGITVPEKLLVGRDRNLHFTVMDPDSHKVEFVQVLPGSDHFINKGKHNTDKRVSDRLLHTGITVKDAKKADGFYKDILGFVEFWRGGYADTINWINMRLPDCTDYIEYMLYPGEITPANLHSAHHISLMVPDLQKSIELLSERTNGKNLGAPKVGINKRWLLNMYDPDGTRTELMEPHTVK